MLAAWTTYFPADAWQMVSIARSTRVGSKCLDNVLRVMYFLIYVLISRSSALSRFRVSWRKLVLGIVSGSRSVKTTPTPVLACSSCTLKSMLVNVRLSLHSSIASMKMQVRGAFVRMSIRTGMIAETAGVFERSDLLHFR